MNFGRLFDFLPWRRRRKEHYQEDQDKRRDPQQEIPLVNVTVNGDFRAHPDYYRSKSRKSCSRKDTSGGRGLTLLAMLMNSDEFQRGDSAYVRLLKCIYQGSPETLSDFMDQLSREEIDAIEMAGQRLLHILCFKKDVEYLELFLSKKINPDPINRDGVTPLHLAVSEGWVEGVEILLSEGASANILPVPKRFSAWPFNELPILTAARNGDFEICCLLLDETPDLTLTDPENNNILHLACFSHSIALVKMILEDEFVLDLISSTNNKGNSPIHSLMNSDDCNLAEKEIVECVRMLIPKGADVNHLNAANKTPLYYAASRNLPMVVNTLLNAGADPTIKSLDGKTVLHAACYSSSHESLSILLERKEVSSLVLVEDSFHNAPFHAAVSSCSINCCELLLRSGDHLTRLDSNHISRCNLVVKGMPSALQLLRKVFDGHIKISDKDQSDADFCIKMDFSVLLSRSSQDVEASLISDINGPGMDALLKHPLVEAFLYLKWHRIRWFFYAYVLIYKLFLIVHTFYIVKTYGMHTNWDNQQSVLRMVHVIHVILVLILMIPGTITMFANLSKYFKQWETYFKAVALTTAAFVVFSRESTFRDREIEKNVASVSIFFTWVEFMMLLGRFPSLGVYILMFTRVAKYIIRFLFAFSPLLIAFTLSFGLLFSNIPVFKSFPIGFVKTLMMMIGEIDYSDIYEASKEDNTSTMIMGQIFLVVFLFLIPVLMANLLIGLAVNDLPDLQYHGKVRRLVKEASYLESYERLLLVFKEWTCMPNSIINLLSGGTSIKKEITIYPNRRNKYRMNSITIPSDAIKAALVSGTKESSKKKTEDLETFIRRFYKEYNSSQERIEKDVQTILNILSSPEDSRGTDVPDGALKNKRSAKFRRRR